jgi:hypothetical protein
MCGRDRDVSAEGGICWNVMDDDARDLAEIDELELLRDVAVEK